MTVDTTTISAIIVGVVIPFLVGLVTKEVANTQTRNLVASALSVLGGAVSTVVYDPNAGWKAYLYNIAIAFFTAYTVHRTGATAPLERATSNIGIPSVIRKDPPAPAPAPTRPPRATTNASTKVRPPSKAAAERQVAARRSEAAKKAAATRKRNRERADK